MDSTDIILTTLNARYIHASIGLRYLHANLGDFASKAAIQEYVITDTCTDVAERLLLNKPKIIGIAVYIWNAEQVQRLVAVLKAVAPELILVLGGPEVSHEPMRVDFSLADYIIQGEGEKALYDLVGILLPEQDRQTNPRPQSPSADLIRKAPVCIRAKAQDTAALVLPYDRYSDHDIAHRMIYVEASRGCPFRCEFCLSSLDKKVRYFPEQDFLAALETLWQRGARTFKFIDRTFNLRLNAVEPLLDFFLAKEEEYFIHFEVVPDYFPAPLREKLTRFAPGSLQLEVGLQTLNPHVAENISRPLHMDAIMDNISFLSQETAAHLHLDLIIGLPGETVESFAHNLNTLVSLTHAEIQLGVLKKLSGTALNRHDAEWGMVYSDRPPYEILYNTHIPFMEMQTLKRFARFWDLTWNSGNLKQTVHLLWSDLETKDGKKDVFTGFLAFSRWLYATTHSTWKISLKRLAELVFTYLVEEKGLHKQEVADSLALDILTVKGRTLPPLVQEYVQKSVAGKEYGGKKLSRRQERHR